MRNGVAYHGISVVGRGVFTRENGSTYAGQHAGGYVLGLGVTTWSSGYKVYAEHGPDGLYHGRCLGRVSDEHTGYWLYERGKSRDSAHVFADGRCWYNDVACAPDDPRLLVLIAQLAPVEVRPAAPAPYPPTRPPLAPKQSSMDRPARFVPTGAGGRRGHRGQLPFRTPSLVVARHNRTAATLQSTSTQ